MKRENDVRVRFSDEELAQLDELRPPGMARAVYLRSLVHKAPEVTDVATRDEALGILTSLARDGKTTAAIALARELGDGDRPPDPLDDLLRSDD